MKSKRILLAVFLATAVAVAVAAIPSGSVSAQKCYDPITKKEIACPEEKKDRSTVVYPSFTPSVTPTATPTATHTPSAIPAVTSTPTAAEAPIAAAGAPPPAGFSCVPYASSVPLGAAGIGPGLLGLALDRRNWRLGNHRNAALNSIPNPRDPVSGLPAVNQPAGVAAGAVVAGTGAGVLGAGLLAGILGINCIGAPILLPAGALAGLMAALASNFGAASGASPLPATPGQGGGDDEQLSTFQRLTPVDDATEVRGGSGHKDDEDLE